MALHMTVWAADAAAEVKWVQLIKAVTDGLPGTGITLGMASQEEWRPRGQVVLVDGSMPGVSSILSKIERQGRAVFLISSESQTVMRGCMALISAGQADDAIVFPFRLLDVQSKLRHYQQILLWDEVSKLNSSFTGLIDRIQLDLRLAERMQKSKTPVRFPEIKGFRVASRYLAGMKSGGDHLDLAESQSAQQLSIVLADSSSYGLSSSLLSVLMKVAMKLSQDEARSCEDTVRRIHEEIALTLGDKDQLSLFYGVISRKDYRLRYVNLGTSSGYYAPPGKPFEAIRSSGAAISKSAALPPSSLQSEIALEPGGRLALVSDGFAASAIETLNRFRNSDAVDSLNELVYRVKSGFSEPDDMPEQDCTAIVMDVDSKILRSL